MSLRTVMFLLWQFKTQATEYPIKPKILKAQSTTSIESGTLENGDVQSQ
jgi:hypothetical protein